VENRKKKAHRDTFLFAAAARKKALLLIRAKERERERENTWLPKKNERT